MKILVNRKPVEGPWGGGNLFLKSFCKIMKNLGHEIIHSIQPDIDIFFIMNPRYNELGISINEAIAYKQKNKSTKIIQRINDCDARKNTSGVDELLIECSKYLDSTIFVSEWMKNYFLSKGWHCNKNYVVINGVETITDNVEKIKNKKLNIVTHHWSNNYLKGFDIYDQLDEFVGKNNEYTFSYVGRERGTFKNTIVIPPLAGEELYKELKKYDVYVSASRYDPGPNHILESISCNLPTYVHKDGGGCVEFAGSSYVFNNFEELVELLKQNNHQKNKNKFVGWKESIVSLNKIIENLLKGN